MLAYAELVVPLVAIAGLNLLKNPSLRSSRFLSFSKRSRTGGKLRKSSKISSRGRGWGDGRFLSSPPPPPSYSPPPYFSPIFWLTPGVLLRSPAFRSLVRSLRRLKKERNRLLRKLQKSNYPTEVQKDWIHKTVLKLVTNVFSHPMYSTFSLAPTRAWHWCP